MTLKRIALCVLLGMLLRAELVAGDPPDASSLLTKAIQRASTIATNSAVYLYDKRTTIDSLDSEGETTKRKVKLFLVTVTDGVPNEKLIAVEGKKLSAKELKQEEEKTKRWGRRLEKRNKGDSKRTFVPADLLKKFDVSYVDQQTINGRTTHILVFKPKPSAPKPKTFTDRVLNQMTGRVWIDSVESAVSRLEVSLGKRVTVWGGVLGALNRFELTLVRQRTTEGIWFNQLAEINLDARGLLKRFRMNIKERSSNFRRAAE